MKLIFDRSVAGRGQQYLPACDVEEVALPASLVRESAPKLPEVSENDLSRHYTELNKQVHGVNDGFYPLGSCTMKYNPRIDEEMAALPGFANVHPLAPANAVEGCKEALDKANEYFCEIFGMDACTFQPAAGAHGEFTGEYFHEFVTEMPKADEVLKALENANILGGLQIEEGVLWCATEKVTKADLDRTVAIVKEVCA